jgi:O-antigen/teichoic acid export membrane protein
MGEKEPHQWLRLLAPALREKIRHRPNLLLAINNTGWLFGDKVLRLGLGLLVGVWVARYLGPEQFGLLNYAVAVVALFGAVASVGLNGIVVRDLVNQPEAANSTLGSSFTLQFVGGLVAFALAVLAIQLLRPDEPLAKQIVALLGFTLIFKASDVVRYWFESQVQSRYVVWVDNGVFLVLVLIKIALVLGNAPLMAFVWVIFAEALLVAIGLLVVYARRGGRLASWRTSAGRIKRLLADSWPLVLSGLAVMIYMRIDQIMLGQMLGDEAVGVYTAATRISEVWYFVPTAIISSVLPALIAARKADSALFLARMQKLYDFMFLLAIAVAIPMSFLSDPVMTLLFGDAYAGAGGILSIHIWSGVFVFLGLASSQWLILEGRQKAILQRTLLGAIINVFANMLLIPAYGAVGAAYATVLSYFIAVFSVGLRAETRLAYVMMGRSMFLVSFFKAKSA